MDFRCRILFLLYPRDIIIYQLTWAMEEVKRTIFIAMDVYLDSDVMAPVFVCRDL